MVVFVVVNGGDAVLSSERLSQPTPAVPSTATSIMCTRDATVQIHNSSIYVQRSVILVVVMVVTVLVMVAVVVVMPVMAYHCHPLYWCLPEVSFMDLKPS